MMEPRDLAPRVVALVLSTLTGLGGALPPALANEPAAPPRPLSLHLAVETAIARADVQPALQTGPQASAGSENDKPFFKTRRGVVASVLMVAGLSWVIYSKSHDRVRSPVNQ
jgi:hypothetical protein